MWSCCKILSFVSSSFSMSMLSCFVKRNLLRVLCSSLKFSLNLTKSRMISKNWDFALLYLKFSFSFSYSFFSRSSFRCLFSSHASENLFSFSVIILPPIYLKAAYLSGESFILSSTPATGLSVCMITLCLSGDVLDASFTTKSFMEESPSRSS